MPHVGSETYCFLVETTYHFIQRQSTEVKLQFQKELEVTADKSKLLLDSRATIQRPR